MWKAWLDAERFACVHARGRFLPFLFVFQIVSHIVFLSVIYTDVVCDQRVLCFLLKTAVSTGHFMKSFVFTVLVSCKAALMFFIYNH